MNADHKPASVLEPLLDRVRVLNESRSATQARDYRDEQAAHALLADVGQLVTELQAGHVMDAAELPAPAAEQPTAGPAP